MLKKIIVVFGLMTFCVNVCSYAEEEFFDDSFEDVVVEPESEERLDVDVVDSVPEITEQTADEISAAALNDYDASGSLFEKITMLEQEKVVVQLEKERAQLDLELERLNAERIKLQMELDTLSGRAEQQQKELEAAKQQLEIQTERLRQQKNSVEKSLDAEESVLAKPVQKNLEIGKKYKLINVFGVDNQLQATIEDVATGQNKRVSVGKDVDGYIVKSISLNDGIVFEKDGDTESLNIGK